LSRAKPFIRGLTAQKNISGNTNLDRLKKRPMNRALFYAAGMRSNCFFLSFFTQAGTPPTLRFFLYTVVSPGPAVQETVREAGFEPGRLLRLQSGVIQLP
jgi:hypothetical protein